MNKREIVEKSKMRVEEMGEKRKSGKRNALRIRVEKRTHTIAIKEPHFLQMQSVSFAIDFEVYWIQQVRLTGQNATFS